MTFRAVPTIIRMYYRPLATLHNNQRHGLSRVSDLAVSVRCEAYGMLRRLLSGRRQGRKGATTVRLERKRRNAGRFGALLLLLLKPMVFVPQLDCRQRIADDVDHNPKVESLADDAH